MSGIINREFHLPNTNPKEFANLFIDKPCQFCGQGIYVMSIVITSCVLEGYEYKILAEDIKIACNRCGGRVKIPDHMDYSFEINAERAKKLGLVINSEEATGENR